MKLLRRLKVYILNQLRHSVLSGFLFKDKPVILTDKYGMRFVLYPSTHEPLEKLLTRRYLVGEYEAMSKIIKPGDTVIDIGANVGTHSVFISRIVGKNGKVYAFEPITDTAWELKENLALNHIENTEVVVAACKDRDGVETMNIFPSDFSAWNSFGLPDTDESKPVKQLQVLTTRLDTFVKTKNINNIDFVKIDAEGTEKDILIGAHEVLKSGKIDTFSFEVSEIPLRGTGGASEDIFDLIKSYGYSIYSYDGRQGKFIPGIGSKNQCENYYASRRNLTLL